MKQKILIASFVLALFTVACGAVRIPGVPGVGGNNPQQNRNRATRTPGPTVAPIDTRAAGGAFTPIPTYDVVSKLVTQAYALYTPTPGAAATKAPATPAPSNAGTSGGGVVVAATPAPGSNVIYAPSSVIVSETNNFPNFTNKAACSINKVGDCTPVVKANQDVYFTWTFTNNSTRLFTYGDAMIIITRDGQSFAQTQAINGRGQTPPDKNAKWQLVVGDFAIFRAGIDKIQPGAYTARLQVCQNDPVDCRAGLGWQNVGNEYINFTVAP